MVIKVFQKLLTALSKYYLFIASQKLVTNFEFVYMFTETLLRIPFSETQ